MNLHRPRFRCYLLLLVSSLIFAMPLIWMFTCSLKSQAELIEHPYSLLPTDWNWQNYPDAVQSMPYLRYLGNSLFLCTLNVIGSLLSCSLVAYGFARLRWRGRRLLFGILIATMLLPWHVTMIPRFLLFRELHLYNSMAALIILESAISFLGFGVQIPTSSWGNMIAESRRDLAINIWPCFWPALTLVLTVFSINNVADWVRKHMATRTSALV